MDSVGAGFCGGKIRSSTESLPRFPMDPKDLYQQHIDRVRARQEEFVRAGQEVGELPPVGDPARKELCRGSFRAFCESYFSEAFALGWSPDHLKAIAKIEEAVKGGGLFALAMPRGSGKTTLCMTAVLWAALYGYSAFVVLVAASADRARDLLENIKVWLETNQALFEDFPEVCVPVRALERIVLRQKGQKYMGEATRIEWLSDRVVLPFIPGSAAAGVVIACSGMKGSDIRGQNFSRPDGRVIRPDLVLIDDPQTSESAWSNSQSARRVAILSGDVLGMAGPGRKIAGLMACTVIRPGDMADQILDRTRHPDWHGERTKLVYAFPKNGDLWAKYAEIRSDELINDGDGSQATAFYAEHREEMDEGAVVAWPQRFNSDELSAIQHAMNLRHRDEAAFYSEYQNEPLSLAAEADAIDAGEAAARVNGLPCGTVPAEAAFLTAFIDVHDKLLYYALTAWKMDFSGVVVDYGTYPDQPGRYFTMDAAKRSMSDLLPDASREGYLRAGIEALFRRLLDRGWYKDSGQEVTVDKLMIDANWGETTDLVYSCCRLSPWRDLITPSHGRFVGANSRPFSDYRKQPGDRVGSHWRSPAPDARRGIRHVVFDANYWKSFLRSRLSVPVGDPSALSFWGDRPNNHKLLGEHLAAELPVHVDNGSRRLDEWRLKPAKPDNHWLDCLVGCCVAAAVLGCSTAPDAEPAPMMIRKRVSFADLQRKVKG